MKPSRNATFLALLVTITLIAAARGADDAYYIERRVSTPGVKTVSVKYAPGERHVPIDQLWRSDSKGTTQKLLTDSRLFIRAFSVSDDGKELLCHLVGDQTPGKFSSRLMIVESGGKVLKTINLADLDVRVFGAPTFLSGHKRIGITACKLTDAAATKSGKKLPADPRSPNYSKNLPDLQAAREQWNSGEFPSDPFVATIDLDGKDLRMIGPGALPVWSKDGKSILYTKVKRDSEVSTGRLAARLSMMDADGKNSHFVGPEQSLCGAFSIDGTRIVYVVAGAARTSELFTANTDGTDARRVKAPAGLYACPRPIGNGKVLEVFCQANVPRKGPAAAARKAPPGQTGKGSATAAAAAAAAAAEPERFDGACALTLGEADLHRISPIRDPFIVSTNIDEDAEFLVRRLQTPTEVARDHPRNPKDPGPARKVNPMPAGMTFSFDGSKIWFRDSKGNLSKVPDGHYLFKGMEFIVKDGERYLED